MDFKEMIERLMQQNMQQQAPISDMDMQRIQQQQPQQQAPISDMDIQKMQQIQQQMQQNRLRQVSPEQMQMLQQQLPQSAPAASPEMMIERGGMGALPNAFMERLQQMQQQQVPPNSLGLGYGVQR